MVIWTLRMVALVSVVAVTTAIALTRPAPVRLDAGERAARAVAYFPGWSCPRRA